MMIGVRTAIRPALVIAMSLAGTGITVSSHLYASDVQVGRYSLLSAEPTEAQTDLLATTVTVHFPAQIQTVGESIRYLLRRSGYRLADAVALAPETTDLLALLLPAVHRHLGPITVRRALETLAGSTFNLVQDPVHRLIAFEGCTPDWRVALDTVPGPISEVSTDAE
jgi:type IV pili sensor histidine kinase/response regulator